MRKVDHLDAYLPSSFFALITFTLLFSGVGKEKRTTGEAPAISVVLPEPDRDGLEGDAKLPQKAEVVVAKVRGDCLPYVPVAGQWRGGGRAEEFTVVFSVAGVVVGCGSGILMIMLTLLFESKTWLKDL